MTLDDRTAEVQLTPDARRGMLRAFADRMLIKVTAMDDPEDLPGIERAVRVAAVIERVYSRCDRAETHAPDPRKVEAERARHTVDAIQARVSLANTLAWSDKRRRDLGPWWDAADTAATTPSPARAATPAAPQASRETQAATRQTPSVQDHAGIPSSPARPPEPAPVSARVNYVDYTDAILKARADLGLSDLGLNDEQDHPATGGCDPPLR